jgi:hypothetical protein
MADAGEGRFFKNASAGAGIGATMLFQHKNDAAGARD